MRWRAPARKTLVRKTSVKVIYRRPETSRPEPGHKILAYLMRKVPETEPDQVGAMDVTCVPTARLRVPRGGGATGAAAGLLPTRVDLAGRELLRGNG